MPKGALTLTGDKNHLSIKHDGRKKRKTHIYLSHLGAMEKIVQLMVAGFREEGRWSNGTATKRSITQRLRHKT